jgi:hypothetical protein
VASYINGAGIQVDGGWAQIYDLGASVPLTKCCHGGGAKAFSAPLSRFSSTVKLTLLFFLGEKFGNRRRSVSHSRTPPTLLRPSAHESHSDSSRFAQILPVPLTVRALRFSIRPSCVVGF